METNIILTTLEECVIDALHQNSICSSDFEWIDEATRRFRNYTDASKWATNAGLNANGSDDDIIQVLFSLAEKGLVKRTDSRRKSSEWFSLTSEGNLLREALLSDWPTD